MHIEWHNLSMSQTPANERFVDTRWSVVARAGGQDDARASAALSWLAECYWQPLRLAAQRWGCDEHQAEDAVQDFCCRLVERRTDLHRLTPAGGRFRSWIIVVFRNLVRDRQAHGQALKRGGGAMMVEAVASDPPAVPVPDPDFDHDWAAAVIMRAIDRLAHEHQRDGEQERFAGLRPFLTCNGSSSAYSDVGRKLGISEGAVKVSVHRLRQRLRELARHEVGETLIDPTPEDIDDELEILTQALLRKIR
jgi:RNA polymerase sigma factor (sigma-70 family)